MAIVPVSPRIRTCIPLVQLRTNGPSLLARHSKTKRPSVLARNPIFIILYYYTTSTHSLTRRPSLFVPVHLLERTPVKEFSETPSHDTRHGTGAPRECQQPIRGRLWRALRPQKCARAGNGPAYSLLAAYDLRSFFAPSSSRCECALDTIQGRRASCICR